MSKIEVNKIGPQCGTTLTVGCGAGQTVVADAATVTLGRCGGTVALASGATQTGFGRTGTVDWDTTPKTATFTGVSGVGYFINSGSALTCNLPAGTAGDIISFSDYARNFETYSFNVSPNGSEKIGGVAENAILNVNGQAATFVYVDSTKGWVNIQNAEDTVAGATPYITATGGTITTVCTNYKLHTFTGPGTFTVTCKAVCAPNNVVDYVVVAGGGGGQWAYGGGGGGGFRYYATTPVNPQTGAPAAPLNNYPGGTAVTVDNLAYPITVGAGGTGSPSGPSGNCNSAGSNSIFSTITSAGGGKGGNYTYPGASQPGVPGGSGGGGGSWPGPGANPAGTGNTPPTSPSQGNPGGLGWHTSCDVGGGGGGALTVGSNAAPPYLGGNAGVGAGIKGFGTTGELQPASSTRAFSGGGGGAAPPGGSPYANRGVGGGSNGNSPSLTPTPACGAANQGGGGGGGNFDGCTPGAAGSGVVMIRYRFQ